MNTDKRTGWGGPPVVAPGLADFRSAARLMSRVAVRTPLVPLHSYGAGTEIWLKPETLQPIGSFKLRGVYNWAARLSPRQRSRGLSTTSSGNTAQALGYVARLFGVSARTLVPEWLPDNKTQAIVNYGVTPVRVTLDDLLAYMLEERWKEEPYTYLNPWGDPGMIAGHGTIGLEILEDDPDVETVYVPVGGGALVCGIGAALKALKPGIRVIGVQGQSNPSLAAAFRAGGPLWIEHRPTVCEGASIPVVVAEMYPLLRELVDDVALVPEEGVKAAIRRLALRNKLVAEGAGAESLAAALATPLQERGRTVCVISGGSISAELLMTILAEDTDRPQGSPHPGNATEG